MSFLNHRRTRSALVALALVALVAIAFGFEPVRVAANDFLSIFRVQKFAVIPLGPDRQEELQELGAILDQNFFLNEPEFISAPEEMAFDTLEAAAEAVDFTVRSLGYVPGGFEPTGEFRVSTAGEGLFQVDLELARSLFELVDLDPALLPDSLAEEPLAFKIPPTVTMVWKYLNRTGLTFIQAPSPEVDYPDDVDPEKLGAAALQLLGLSEREARRLSETIDWTSTVVLPIPTDIVEFREVTVDGASGVLLTEKYDQRGSHSALLWQKDGIVYLLQGNMQASDLMAVADSIH